MHIIKRIVSVLTASLLLFSSAALPASAAAPWNVTGNYEITFLLDGDPTPYVHHATLTQNGSAVTGDGGYPATGGDTYHWNVTSGTQTGNDLDLTVAYDLGAIGTTMEMDGTIASDGTVTGTWTDDLNGGTRTGTWILTKGVSVPRILTPLNGAVVTPAQLVEVDWTDSVGVNPPFEYQYQAFSDANYTNQVYLSGWLSASEIATPGTPVGEYYLRVRARNASEESAWSNGASNPYYITVVYNTVPVPAECNQNVTYNVIEGTAGNNTLNGTGGADLILARGGNDLVNGNGGNDCVVGGNGSDLLRGGQGNDVILGGAGSDSIQGEGGADQLYGEGDSDAIRGGADNDNLWGGIGADSLQGEGGNDTANGGAGSDACSAESLAQCNP